MGRPFLDFERRPKMATLSKRNKNPLGDRKEFIVCEEGGVRMRTSSSSNEDQFEFEIIFCGKMTTSRMIVPLLLSRKQTVVGPIRQTRTRECR